MSPQIVEPIFFPSAARFGAWLERHHATATELWVGFWKVSSGQPTLTWSESVDEALCFGWIDGVRKSAGQDRYVIRFTPRKPGSKWSLVNLRKVEALKGEGRMRAAGLAAWKRRNVSDPGYSFERTDAITLANEELTRFRKQRKAWAWFEGQPPGYRKLVLHWVTSAKRPETRERRLATLMADCAEGRRIAQLRRDDAPARRRS
jgi:uncharacterized protein YdeI (YjbR/CyaY-like superfamily)